MSGMIFLTIRSQDTKASDVQNILQDFQKLHKAPLKV